MLGGRLTPEQDFSAEGSATAAERRRVSERRRILDAEQLRRYTEGKSMIGTVRRSPVKWVIDDR